VDDDFDYWRDHPNPSEAEIREVCETWVRYQRRYVGTAEGDAEDPDWWAIHALILYPSPPPRELEWHVILMLCELVDSDETQMVDMIGAAPLEDFLVEHGDAAMDLIEPAADQNPTLLKALAHVWAFEEPVRPRIERYLQSRG
jgi:hypothetical protein